MKLLLVSDLHQNAVKFDWVLAKAAEVEAVLVAGDLLNIFSEESWRAQIDRACAWLRQLQAASPALAWCSGNHDFFRGEDTRMLSASPAWLQEITLPGVLGDGASGCMTDLTANAPAPALALTSIPWPVTGNQVRIGEESLPYTDYVNRLVEEGQALREESGVPWLLLFHEPPEGSRLAPDYDLAEAYYSRSLLDKAGPDFSYHGHIHEGPMSMGGRWVDQVGRTVAFNAGQSGHREKPNAIVLEISPGGLWQATWWLRGREEEQVIGKIGRRLPELGADGDYDED